MHDVERGEIELEEGKTLRDYITYYANSAKNSQVEKITKAFGVDGALLNKEIQDALSLSDSDSFMTAPLYSAYCFGFHSRTFIVV